MNIFDKIKKGKEKEKDNNGNNKSNSKPKQGSLFAGMSVKPKKQKSNQNVTECNDSRSINDSELKNQSASKMSNKTEQKHNFIDSNDILEANGADINPTYETRNHNGKDGDLYNLLDNIEQVDKQEQNSDIKPKKKPAFGFIKNKKQAQMPHIANETKGEKFHENNKKANDEENNKIEEETPKPAFKFIKGNKKQNDEIKTEELNKEKDVNITNTGPDSVPPNIEEDNKDTSPIIKTESFRAINDFNESNLEISIKKSRYESIDQSNNSLAENDTIEQITNDLGHIGIVHRIENDFKIDKIYTKISKRLEDYGDRVFLILSHLNKAEDEEESKVDKINELSKEITDLDDQIAIAVSEEDFTKAEEFNQLQNNKREQLEQIIENKDGFLDQINLLDIKDSALVKIEKSLYTELQRLLEDKITIREKRTLYERESSYNFEKRQEELEESKHNIDTEFKSIKKNMVGVEKRLSDISKQQDKEKQKFLKKNEELNASKENVETEIEKLRRELAAKEKELGELEEQINENETEVKEIDQTFEQRKKEILMKNEALYDQNSVCDQKMSEVNSKLEELDAERNIQKDELQRLDEMIDSISKSESNYKSKVEDLKKVMSASYKCLMNYASIKREYDLKTANISRIKMEIESDEKLISQLENEIEAKNGEIDEIETEIPKINSKKQEAIANKNFASAGQLNKELQRLQTRLSILKNEIEVAIEKIEDTSKKLPEKKSELDELMRTSSEFVIGYHEKLVESLKSRLELSNTIKKNGIDGIDTEITQIEQKLKLAVDKLSQLKNNNKTENEVNAFKTAVEPEKLAGNANIQVPDEQKMVEEKVAEMHSKTVQDLESGLIDAMAIVKAKEKIAVFEGDIENAIAKEDFDRADACQKSIDKLSEKIDFLKNQINNTGLNADDFIHEAPEIFNGFDESSKNEVLAEINKILE